MDHKKIRAVGAGILVAVWLALTGFAWFGPTKDISEAERRPLEQMPEITLESLLDGKFMGKFEDFTLDQFPLRDTFRQLKALFHYNALGQMDNNGIYVADDFAAQLEFPLNQDSVDHAAKRFQAFYEKYLKDTGSQVYMTVVPDKGYYLAQKNGYLAMDYAAMFDSLKQQMPWATYVDITDCLDYTHYYRTDTHWRQEHLLPVAQKLCEAMGVTAPNAGDFTAIKVERPFYGVYYGQAALPMDAENIYYLRSDLLDACQVYQFETGAYSAVYDMSKLDSKDLYDIFLSGPRSLLTIENPNATTDRELVIVRDSFGSSIAPLLVQDYAKVTLVDIRYLNMNALGHYLEWKGQDVLFLYSTLVLNNSETIQ